MNTVYLLDGYLLFNNEKIDFDATEKVIRSKCRLFDAIYIHAKLHSLTLSNAEALAKYGARFYVKSQLEFPAQHELEPKGKQGKWYVYVYYRKDIFKKDSIVDKKVENYIKKEGLNDIDAFFLKALVRQYVNYLKVKGGNIDDYLNKVNFKEDFDNFVYSDLVSRFYESYVPNKDIFDVESIIERSDENPILSINRIYKKYIDSNWEFDKYNPEFLGHKEHYV